MPKSRSAVTVLSTRFAQTAVAGGDVLPEPDANRTLPDAVASTSFPVKENASAFWIEMVAGPDREIRENGPQSGVAFHYATGPGGRGLRCRTLRPEAPELYMHWSSGGPSWTSAIAKG